MVYEFESPHFKEPVRISLRQDSTTIAANDSFSFDVEGRLMTASVGTLFFKRGLNNRILCKSQRWKPGLHEYVRFDLSPDEKTKLFSRVENSIKNLIDVLPADVPPALIPRLDRILEWSSERYENEGQRFIEVYQQVGILPPDQYMSVVLQATQGCHYNRCTFCSFYREIPFKIRDENSFAHHITDVRNLLGRGIGLRRKIFLADANALVIPQKKLVPLFKLLNREFDIAPGELQGKALSEWKFSHPDGMTGVYSFIDAFTGTRKTHSDFQELAAMGLRRVYIGMESGHIPLLRFLRKPSMPDDVLYLTETARSAGIGIGVIILVGIGGTTFADGHISDTLDVLRALNLNKNDILYLSEYVDESGSEYRQMAEEAGIEELEKADVFAQADTFRKSFSNASGPKIATYDIREFVY